MNNDKSVILAIDGARATCMEVGRAGIPGTADVGNHGGSGLVLVFAILQVG